MEDTDKKSPDADGKTLAEARKAFDRCFAHESANRATALEDINFARLEKQWPTDILTQRQREGRPCLTINKLPAFIRQVVNDSRQNKPSISVHPVDDNADPETAEVLAGIIRNIETISNADVSYDTAIEQAVTCGFGYWRVVIDYAYQDSFDLDLRIDRVVNQFSVYGDPNSTAVDSSDWDVCFITDKITKEEFKSRYKDKADTDFTGGGWANAGEWLNDDTVMIAEWWQRKEVDKAIAILSDGRVFSKEDIDNNPDLAAGISSGMLKIVKERTIKAKKVTQTFMTGAEILEVKDHPGCYIPIVPVYGDEILVEGKRYFRSLIHGAIDAQRMFNYWRSTSTELIALAPRIPFIGEEGAFDADPNWSTANSASHPYLEYSKGKNSPQRQPIDTGSAGGVLQEAMNASDDMKAIIGMYDASLGARSNETSGRAIMARQREGDVSTFHFIDNVTRAIRHTGRILIDLIPHVYSGERVMRVLGEDGVAKKKPVNQKYPKTDEQGQPVMEESPAGQDQEGNEIQQAVMAMHDLSVGKYDIIVKSGPSFTSRREEAAAQMTDFIQSFPQGAPLVADLLAKNFDWPGGDEIAKRFKAQYDASNPSPDAGEPQIPPEIQQQIEEGKQMLEHLQQENEALKSGQATEQAKLQNAMQAKQAEMQMTMQIKQAELQQTMQLKQQEMQMNMEIKQQELAQAMEFERMKMGMNVDLSHAKLAHRSHMNEFKINSQSAQTTDFINPPIQTTGEP